MTRAEWNDKCAAPVPPSVWVTTDDGKKMRITSPEHFMANWEAYFSEATSEELGRVLQVCSPFHPDPNMQWLYDRVLMAMVQ